MDLEAAVRGGGARCAEESLESSTARAKVGGFCLRGVADDEEAGVAAEDVGAGVGDALEGGGGEEVEVHLEGDVLHGEIGGGEGGREFLGGS